MVVNSTGNTAPSAANNTMASEEAIVGRSAPEERAVRVDTAAPGAACRHTTPVTLTGSCRHCRRTGRRPAVGESHGLQGRSHDVNVNVKANPSRCAHPTSGQRSTGQACIEHHPGTKGGARGCPLGCRGQLACWLLAQPLHAACHTGMADLKRGPRLPLVQRLGHARQHLHQAFAAAGAVVGKVSRPGIKLMARNGVPRLALPGAKIPSSCRRASVL